MTIHFTETEEEDRRFFRKSLKELDLYFLDKHESLTPETDILSIFIGTRVDDAFLDTLPKLRLLATRSRAVDHIDDEACRRRGVIVSNVPDYGEIPVAEHTFALLLAISRRLRELMVMAKASHDFSYSSMRAFDLRGKTLGLVGLGKIGQRVCSLARAFEMKVIAFDPCPVPTEVIQRLGVQVVSFEELLADSDIISLHVNLSSRTHHMLNRQTLALCREGAIIINTARGRLIDTQALREALDTGRIGAAGLDVLEEESVMRQSASSVISDQILEHLRSDVEPEHVEGVARLRNLQALVGTQALLERPNVVFTPHVAFNSVEAVDRILEQTAENIRAFIVGTPSNAV